jgi:hypothetical protein
MRNITKILVALVALVACVGCFKEEKQGTRMLIALYSQNVKDDPVMKTTSEIEAYAFWVPKGTKWEVKSWEDALECRITNTERKEQLTAPDVIGTFDAEAEYQVELDIWSHTVFMVVVDRTNKIYATRFYETPVNLPEVMAQLHHYAYKKSGNANGWDMVNPFPDEPREPLVPVEENEIEESDNE